MVRLTGKKIAIIVHNFFEQLEMTEPRKALEGAGATVELISANGTELQGVNHIKDADKFQADRAIEEVVASEYDAVVIPGGVVNADNVRMNESARKFVRDMMTANKVVAAICHGPWLLVSSGVVKGRKLTSYPTVQDDIRNAGGEWSDDEVVVDGNLITSRRPSDLSAFNAAILNALS